MTKRNTKSMTKRKKDELRHFGFCRICGLKSNGMSFGDWVKDTFTNFDNLKQGDIICEQCLFKFDERSEILAKKVGKEKSQRMRNYSHFILDGEWIPLGKDKKSQMADLLLNHNPTTVVISESGQKHLWFRARPGMWQFEETSIVPNKKMLRYLLVRIERLLDVFSKTEIERGHYKHRRIFNFGFDRWQYIESEIRQHRGSQYFELALFLGQKAEKRTDENKYTKNSEKSQGSKVLSLNLY